MFLQLMVLRRKRTSQKHTIYILIIQIIVLKIQLQIITKKVSRLQRYRQLFLATMKPKKLENGRIPVSKSSEKVESDKQNDDKYVAKTQTSQNKHLEQEKQKIVLSSKELHLNHLMKMYHQQQNQHLIIQKLIILSKLKTFMLHKLLKKLDVNENVKCFKSVDLKKRCKQKRRT